MTRPAKTIWQADGRGGADGGTEGEQLRLALPSKGRLLDPTLAFLESCGFAVKGARGSRDYTARIPALPGCVVDLMAASEIPQRLAAGEVHLGVTGLDLIAELAGRTPPSIEAPDSRRPGMPIAVQQFGFGRADLVVAVPRAWIDVDTMADVAEVAQAYRRRHGRRMRIATKYRTLARAFCADHAVPDYRIIRSEGATEAAPVTGLADVIVDITSTGTTLAANHLKTLRNGKILSSYATLFASGAADVTWSAPVLETMRRLLDMIDAKINAASRKMMMARLDSRPGLGAADFAQTVAALEKALTAIVQTQVQIGRLPPLDGADEGVSVMLTAPADRAYDVVTLLRAHGAREVIVQDTDYVFDFSRSSFELTLKALGIDGKAATPPRHALTEQFAPPTS